MNNSLTVYLSKRLKQNEQNYHSVHSEKGPVICISREVGCGGLNIAKLLAAELDKVTICKKWRVLSKEILEESARELDMNPMKLQNIMHDGTRGIFDEILNAFSDKRFKSDRKITKTMVEIISSFAIDGHCIIVGRAGHILSKDIPQSLLIKITAPLEWRINQIIQKDKISRNQALDFIRTTEAERENFRKHIEGVINKEDEFDLTINLSRMTIPEVIAIIKQAAQTKGLLQNRKSKVEVF
jgi:cytidylate kinase